MWIKRSEPIIDTIYLSIIILFLINYTNTLSITYDNIKNKLWKTFY